MACSNCCCFICIKEKEVAIVENLGQYNRTASAGCNILMCPLETVAGSLSLRIQQLNVTCDTKTKDNVFIKVAVAVQYYAIEEKAYEAWYKLTNHKGQITSYVFDGIRSSFPKLDLDAAFESKDSVAKNVQEQLASQMEEYGYRIVNVLIVDVEPDGTVKNAMNEINAQQRLREANSFKADAEKILLVKAAEAESESKHMTGVGIARQRKALCDGLSETVADYTHEVSGTTPKDVMDLLLLSQYFDMMKEVGHKSVSGTMLLPHAPDSVYKLRQLLAHEGSK
jgi:regulator of protease activity HflC (stomatin/prohibitin superfamily)